MLTVLYMQCHVMFRSETSIFHADVHALVFTPHTLNDQAELALYASVNDKASTVAIDEVPRRADDIAPFVL